MALVLANNGLSKLASPITSSATTLTVLSDDGAEPRQAGRVSTTSEGLICP